MAGPNGFQPEQEEMDTGVPQDLEDGGCEVAAEAICIPQGHADAGVAEEGGDGGLTSFHAKCSLL